MIKAGYNHARPIMRAGVPNHSSHNHDLLHTTHGGANSSKLTPGPAGYIQGTLIVATGALVIVG